MFTVTGNFALKINNTVVLSNGLITAKCLVSAVDNANKRATLLPYQGADITATFGAVTDNYKLFVYGNQMPHIYRNCFYTCISILIIVAQQSAPAQLIN